MANLLEKITGTISSFFQIGVGGPRVKNNGGLIEARNAADSGFVIVRGATPVATNDLTTKQYVDTISKPFLCSAQFNGSSSLPNNSSVEKYIIVTTTGVNASIGQVLWDNGLNDGNTVTVLGPTNGMCVAIQAALSGGTITFQTDSIYIWDNPSTTWIKIGDIGSVTGAIRLIRYAITNAATQDSTSTIPTTAFIVKSRLQLTTPYSGGATISVGQPGATTAFMLTTDNDPVGYAANDAFEVPQDTAAVSPANVVRTTVGGSPAAGAGIVSVWYSSPNV